MSETSTIAAVSELAHAYEAALVAGDGAAAAAFFADGDDVTRFGPEGAQYGSDEVRNLRKSYAPVPIPEWLYDEVVVTSTTTAIHKAVMRRNDSVLQRTQIWVRNESRNGVWAIVHAHVSRVPAP